MNEISADTVPTKTPAPESPLSAEELADQRKVARSSAQAGDRDLRDAETFRALREQEQK